MLAHAQAQNARPALNAQMMAAMSIEDMAATAERLFAILETESTLLKDMRIQELAKQQDEKLKLTAVLELYQQRLSVDPDFVRQLDAAQREDLLTLMDDLAFMTEENFRNVASAKAVNARVVQAIMDVMSDQHRPNTYGKNGSATNAGDLTLSMNLNQKA